MELTEFRGADVSGVQSSREVVEEVAPLRSCKFFRLGCVRSYGKFLGKKTFDLELKSLAGCAFFITGPEFEYNFFPTPVSCQQQVMGQLAGLLLPP